MNWRIVIASIAALVAVVVLRWLLPGPYTTIALPGLPETQLDYTLTDFSARFRDTDGTVELEVSGPYLEHDSATRIATINQPRFHHQPDQADWRGQARLGLLLRDDGQLELSEEVVLTHPTDSGEMRIEAETIHYDGQARLITGTGPVIMQQPGTWLSAGGLTIRLDEDRVELTDHVQGQMETAGSGDPAGTAGAGAGLKR